MKKYLILGAVVLALLVGYYIYIPNNNYKVVGSTPTDTKTEESSVGEMSVYRNTELGYEFVYPDGAGGYIMLENNDSNDRNFVSGLSLVNKVEYEAFKASTEPTEGPTSMSLRVYTNPENLSPKEWAEVKTLETNYDLVYGHTQDENIETNNSLHFVAEGLYQIDTYVIMKDGYVYLLTGSYIDTNSEIYRDFQTLVASFTFTKEARPQERINVQEVCRWALAYMTFSTSEDVDKFMTECMNGEHPEVIERYVKDTGLDGANI